MSITAWPGVLKILTRSLWMRLYITYLTSTWPNCETLEPCGGRIANLEATDVGQQRPVPKRKPALVATASATA